ncbi:MAG TPA: SIMPL domain-containing protein, partial [Armatimonadota bacterium]|nr:SIMPL domain-containing protein [Armatimonadota bacterium]
MKKRATLLLAAVALFAVAMAPPASGAVERPDQDLLIVSGRGEARVTPNIAVVRLGVESRSARAAEAIQDADRRMNQVLQAIRAQNIPERNIQTVIYNVSRQYRPR